MLNIKDNRSAPKKEYITHGQLPAEPCVVEAELVYKDDGKRHIFIVDSYRSTYHKLDMRFCTQLNSSKEFDRVSALRNIKILNATIHIEN